MGVPLTLATAGEEELLSLAVPEVDLGWQAARATRAMVRQRILGYFMGLSLSCKTMRCDSGCALRLVGRMRGDAQCVDAAAHQRRDSRIDHSMPLELRAAGKDRGHQRHPIVATLPRARVPGMAGAVIDHVDGQRGERLL